MERPILAVGGIVLLGWAVLSMNGVRACLSSRETKTLLDCYPEAGWVLALALGGIFAIFWGAVHKNG